MPDARPSPPNGSIDAILTEIAEAAQAMRAEHGSPATHRRLGDRLAALSTEEARRHGRAHEPIADWTALKGCDDATFIRDAYLLVLGRPADEEGYKNLSGMLAAGTVSRPHVLRSLLSSPEAQGRGVVIRGLAGAILLERAQRLPIVGRVIRLAAAWARLPWHLAVIERRMSLGEERQQRVLHDIDRMVAEMNRTIIGAKTTFAEVETEFDATSAQIEELVLDGRRQDREIEAKLEEAKATHRQSLIETGQLRALVADARRLLPAARDGAAGDALAAIDEHALDDLYLAFENRFRGAPETIAERLRRYLPVMAATPAVAAGGVVLDIGCGRGEWLTLLNEAGHGCRGIDLNNAMVAAARERGHDVLAGDVIAHLRGLPDNSLGAITAFHLVEHLPFPVLIALLDEANRTLKPGGAILFETPNPECLVVGACNFYLDPTHRNPLPPELLRFLAAARAFAAPRIIRRDEDCDLDRPESGFAPAGVDDWFQMPMDYAVYAQRT